MLPLLLSPERDETLLQLTEGRIPVFAHDMVPDYLRTKPEPTAEARMLQHEQKVWARETVLELLFVSANIDRYRFPGK